MAERMLPVVLVLVAIGYALAAERASRVNSRPIDLRAALVFVGAIAVLALALTSPHDSASAHRLSWHMVQHLLLISVAAPLLAVAHPFRVIADLLPRQFDRLRGIRDRSDLATTAASATAALAVLLVWHVPALYDAALRNQTLHGFEHITLLGSSMLLWSQLIRAEHLGSSVLWLFVVTLPMTAFGVAMTIARTPWYPVYADHLSFAAALRDQQMAGVIMWAFGGLAALLGAIAMFASWLAHADATSVAVAVDRVSR
ncbi:MAG TPA: cytochrome c oxidase assembly protein [Ilumatobacteraceae bacterium]